MTASAGPYAELFIQSLFYFGIRNRVDWIVLVAAKSKQDSIVSSHPLNTFL